MATRISKYREKLIKEIDKTPPEHLPYLLELVKIFRESITLKPAEESFKQGLKEALDGETRSISELWEEVDAE